MAQQEGGWPLGLQPLNVRVGLARNHDLNGSFSTLLTASPSSSAGSSSDLDTQSTGSFFHDRSITLGSLLGVSTILELSRRSSTGGRTTEPVQAQKARKSRTWLFCLCSKLSTDAVNPSLGHFLREERRNPSPTRSLNAYGPDDFSRAHIQGPDSNSLFVSGHVAPPQSSSSVSSDSEGEGYGIGSPLLFSCLCGHIAE